MEKNVSVIGMFGSESRRNFLSTTYSIGTCVKDWSTCCCSKRALELPSRYIFDLFRNEIGLGGAMSSMPTVISLISSLATEMPGTVAAKSD